MRLCLLNCTDDASVGLELYLLDGSFGFRNQLVEMYVGLTFELIDPTLSLPQLSRQLVCQCHCPVAILVRQVCRVLQIRNQVRINRIRIPAPKLLS
jgi:hypothetical protein